MFEAAAVFAGTSHRSTVPGEFIKLARAVACFDDGEKWSLLYRILFRLRHENTNLLFIESDKDIRHARLMEKAVDRDVHKFHAFVRFRSVISDGTEVYVAWHEPQHLTVERSVPFFVRRFGTMNFSILTPKGCAHWDQTNITFSLPASKQNAPNADATRLLAHLLSVDLQPVASKGKGDEKRTAGPPLGDTARGSANTRSDSRG